MASYENYSCFWAPYDSRSQLGRHNEERFFAKLAEGRAARDAICDEASLKARQDYVRKAFLDSLGMQPDEYPQPIDSFVTGSRAYDGYTVDNIVILPEPGVYITTNLYLPTTPGPHAAVLFLCGHAAEGKNYPNYAEVCRYLVSAGLAVLAVDPTGQGERWNFYDPETKAPFIRPTVPDHDHAGCRGLLTGRSMAWWFVRDAMCAVSYLCSRDDIDSNRIGVTGNSGGGTQTSMVMLSDRRLAAFAPGTFIMDLGSMQRSGQAQDSEQIWQGYVENGCDHADILLSCAPKPVMVLAVAYDFFPKEGTDATMEECARYWELCGKPENLGRTTDACFHEYSDGIKLAAGKFFSRHLHGREWDGTLLEMPDIEASVCTVSGQTSAEYADFKPSTELYVAYAEQIAGKPGGKEWLAERVWKDRKPMPLNLRPVRATETRETDKVTKWMWRTQKDMFGYGLVITPKDADKVPLTVAIWDGGTSETEAHSAWIGRELAAGRGVFVVDLSGMGQLEPNPVYPNASLYNHYGTMYKLASDMLMLNDSIPALRTFDLLRALEAAKELPVSDGTISLYGFGRSALYARLAAELSDENLCVTLDEAIESYADFLAAEPYDDTDILSHTLPGYLAYFA